MAKRPSAAKTAPPSAGRPRLVARLIGVDRYKGVLQAEGWVEGAAEDARVTAHVAGDPAAPTAAPLAKPATGSGGRPWSVQRAIPRGLGPEALATIGLETGGAVVDQISFPLSLAQDLTEPVLALSRVVPDPACDRIRANGWAYAPGGGEIVELWLDGARVASGPLTLKRPDLAADRPLLARSMLGWSLEVETPDLGERLSRRPPPVFEARLAERPSPGAARTRPVVYEGDLAAAIGRRDRLTAVRNWVVGAPTAILDGLIASRAFRRRWSADPAGEAFAARRLVVDELLARGAVTGERVICLSNGDRVRADPRRDRVMARAFLLKGAYERGFTNWVETVVGPGDVAFDVGVAYGVVSLALARKGARVFAVEANPVMAKAAAANCALNGATGVTIVNKAASDRPGKVTFASVGAENVGSSKIIPNAGAAEKLRFLDELNALSIIDLDGHDGRLTVGDLVVETVEATTLDLLCKKHRLRDVAFVKIDIEGAELIALRGAKKLLDGDFGRPPIVALEFSRIVPVMGGTPEDVFAEFADRGWTVHVQRNGKGEGGPLVRLNAASEAPEHDNIICLPPGRTP